jgi:fructan beta-fructosidase
VRIHAAVALPLLLAAAASIGYDQPYRPQMHFSPREHWTNDPNGLVFFHGEYHLFYQYNPLGDEWGHMSWGHAVSRDLLHWRELPVAIPEQSGEMAFTGSVVVDRENTSGFCAPKTECLVAVYTGYRESPRPARQYQNLAYSLDDGRTWTRYARNPVIDLHMSDFRDPSVSWDETQHRWLMAVSLPLEHKVRFYASPNLKDWTPLSDFGPQGDVYGAWECPDLLQIPSEDGKKEIWALKVGLNPGAPQGGSGEQYFLGRFDGTHFVVSPESGAHGWTNYGKDDYCAISFNNLPAAPVARGDSASPAAVPHPVLIGWMNNWRYAAKLPTSPWRGQMSIPRKLSFLHDEAGLSLQQEPIIAPLRADRADISPPKSGATGEITLQAPFELHLQFGRDAPQTFGVRLYTDEQHWTEIAFDRSAEKFYMDRTQSGADIAPGFATKTTAPLVAGRLYDLQLIVDRSSIEAFAQNGTIAMTNLIFPPSRTNKIVLISTTETVPVEKAQSWHLKSIWK